MPVLLLLGLGVIAIAVGVLSFVPALVALVPLFIAAIPVCFLVWQARKRRLAAQHRDTDGHDEDAMTASDWYADELQKRGDIVDDRVDHLLRARH
jgi:membrane protein implicated in regulation of membrane protease activity